MPTQKFTAWNVDALPRASATVDQEAATGLLLDVVLGGSKLRQAVVPTTSSLGLADPKALANEMLSLAAELTVLAADAEVTGHPMAAEAALAAGRAAWAADQVVAYVALGAVR